MKQYCSIFTAASLALLFSVVMLSSSGASAQHGFSVKQYEEFHELLHPLEHEALPAKDFRRIRANSSELVKHGRKIIKLGVPTGTTEDQKTEFVKELKKFNEVLNRFRTDARKGSDAELKTSFSAVHDSFEIIASMLLRK